MGSEKIGILASVLGAVRNRFFDNFNRANQTGLGTATDGSLWRQVRGQFNISGNQAVGADNNYPMVVVDMPFSNVNIALTGVTQGSAAALWVTDSGNWWAVGIDQVSVTNCQTCSSCVANSGSNCSGNINSQNPICVAPTNSCTGGWNTGTAVTNTWNPFQWTTNSWNPIQTNPCTAWNTPSGGGTCATNTTDPGFCRAWRSNPLPRNCIAWNAPSPRCIAWNAATPGNCKTPGTTFGGNPQSSFAFKFGGTPQTGFQTWTGNSCNAWTSGCAAFGGWNSSFCNAAWNSDVCVQWNTFSCNCVTTFPQYIRIMRSVASVVSEVWSTTVASVVQSFRVQTNGSQITVKAYSDSNLVTQIGSDIVHTPTGVTVVSSFGITIDPSSHNQGYSIDSVEITRN